jgi:hypothetical protein
MHWWILSIFGNEFILFDITQDNLVIALTNLNTVKKYTNYILPITITLHFRGFKFIYCSSHHLSIFLILHSRIVWDTSVTEDLSIRLKQFEHTWIKVGLYSGCDSDATDLRCRFQHRYPIAATTHVIADHR